MSTTNNKTAARTVSAPPSLLRPAEDVQQDTIRRQRECLRLISESHAVGSSTLAELGRQDEQIDRIQDTVDGIEHSMYRAEHHLNNIESWFGSIYNAFARAPPASRALPNPPAAPAAAASSSSLSSWLSPSAWLSTSSTTNAPRTVSARPTASTTQTHALSESERLETESDMLLDEMSRQLLVTRQLATELSQSIDHSTAKLDRLSSSVSATSSRIKDSNRRISKQL